MHGCSSEVPLYNYIDSLLFTYQSHACKFISERLCPETLSVTMDFEKLDINQTANSSTKQFFVESNQTVQLICETDTESIPYWFINDVSYHWQDIPADHTFNVKNTTLEIYQFCASTTEYRCYFSEALQSRPVILLRNGERTAWYSSVWHYTSI